VEAYSGGAIDESIFRWISRSTRRLILGFTVLEYDLLPLEELIAWRDSRNGG
jgi:hypothetical protein